MILQSLECISLEEGNHLYDVHWPKIKNELLIPFPVLCIDETEQNELSSEIALRVIKVPSNRYASANG
jgi:hypothetical protein